MALKDYYDEAELLDSLSWCGMSYEARTTRLANAYIKNERTIKRRSRGYCGPTKGTVQTFVKSLYIPPRGQLASTVRDVLTEIKRQKAVRKRREDNPPLDPQKPGAKSGYGLGSRRNKVAKAHYTTWTTRYSQTPEKAEPAVAGLGSIGNCLVIVDTGGYYARPRIYIKDKDTGRRALYVVKMRTDPRSLLDGLTAVAPKGVLRRLFDGSTCKLTVDGFLLNGELVEFRNVIRAYRDDECERTESHR